MSPLSVCARFQRGVVALNWIPPWYPARDEHTLSPLALESRRGWMVVGGQPRWVAPECVRSPRTSAGGGDNEVARRATGERRFRLAGRWGKWDSNPHASSARDPKSRPSANSGIPPRQERRARPKKVYRQPNVAAGPCLFDGSAVHQPPHLHPWAVPALPPASKLWPQAHVATAFGLWTVNPPPMRLLT